jgi:benzylsuccinate CoA-transferase BbsF subunit
MLAPAHLEYLVNGRDPQPLGNASPLYAPHGCYPCKGDDRWCVISVQSDEEWERFCRVTGHPEWAEDPRFTNVTGRVKHQKQLDELVSSWTAERSPHQVMLVLQREGIAAGAVQNAEDLYVDPHMRERGFSRDVFNSNLGWLTQLGPTANLSETPGAVRHQAHALGEDNEAVFGELLGMSTAEIRKLAGDGVLT